MDAVLKLEQFEGPLDLLLQLIEQEQLIITDISLSKVTEDYFGYLDKLEKNRSEELADFLVIAARLVYLKSRALLPYLYPEEEESGPSLTDQLKMHKRYIEASKDIEKLWSKGEIGYGRNEPPVKLNDFVMPLNTGVEDIDQAIRSLIQRLTPLAPLPQVSIDNTITIKQKIDAIRNLFIHTRRVRFKELLADIKNRTEVIISFLAVLDLAQQKTVVVEQERMFGDLVLRKV